MSGIEAVYIFDEHNNTILTHTFSSRPPSASTVLRLYLSQAEPRSSVQYLSSANPPTILFSILQDRLLFLAPTSMDVEPLLVLEFLHRVADALEEFLGAPLLASRIESNYDVVAQVLGEMCDGGMVGGTEANALRDVVDTPSWVGKLLGGVGLPGPSPALNPSNPAMSSLHARSAFGSQTTLSSSGSQIPWRRSNVRHTSNELYVDIVETLSITYAPSGRPLAAFANGSIAFTSKVSGVPDLLLTLTTGSAGGSSERGERVRRTMESPVFHPCVRLARWKEHGELSFVPPDGRFVLAGYEVDLLDPTASPLTAQSSKLSLPASIDVKTNLGTTGTDFEVRLTINNRFYNSSGNITSTPSSSFASQNLSNNLPRPGAARVGSGTDAKIPLIENLTVSIPIPSSVRNITDIRPSKGEAHWSPGDGAVEWSISAKEAAMIGSAGAVLRCAVVGSVSDDDGTTGIGFGSVGNGIKSDTYDYDENEAVYQSEKIAGLEIKDVKGDADKDGRRVKQNAMLMPTSANLSFSVKGWLASGIKVDSLTVDVRRSKGLGEGVKPYKGVKYLTASRKSIEVRC